MDYNEIYSNPHPKETIMSKNHDQSFAKDIARTTTIAFAANAGAVLGIFGALYVIGTCMNKKNPTSEPQED